MALLWGIWVSSQVQCVRFDKECTDFVVYESLQITYVIRIAALIDDLTPGPWVILWTAPVLQVRADDDSAHQPVKNDACFTPENHWSSK